MSCIGWPCCPVACLPLHWPTAHAGCTAFVFVGLLTQWELPSATWTCRVGGGGCVQQRPACNSWRFLPCLAEREQHTEGGLLFASGLTLVEGRAWCGVAHHAQVQVKLCALYCCLCIVLIHTCGVHSQHCELCPVSASASCLFISQSEHSGCWHRLCFTQQQWCYNLHL